MSKFVILSGPSCIGKSPLHKALHRIYPEWESRLQKLVLYNDRAMRPGETDGEDYHFRTHEEVKALENQDGYLVIPVRDDLQALEIASIHRIMEQGKLPFFEGNPYVIAALQDSGLLDQIKSVTVFLSPLSIQEILFLKNQQPAVNLEKFITQVMRKKQLRRKQKQMQLMSLPDLEDVETRCRAACREMHFAWRYDYVIPNHDGEDSENWSDFHFPVGDAWRTMEAFVSILKEEPNGFIETWDEDVLK
jgi:guanylate kinase